MKRSVFNRISTAVLWICTLITLILSVWFYVVYFSGTVGAESLEISALLNWLYSLLIVAVCTGLIFSLFNYIRQWKENPKKSGRSLAVIIAWGLLLLVAWMLGSENPLSLFGYSGNENTYFWLKITDMWLYSIYILFGLAVLVLFGGIIWSYFKKIK